MLHLEIVTPEKKVFSDKVVDVYLPGADGEIGVLDLHAALVTALAPGELRYQKDGTSHELAIGSGFAEVADDKVIILTDMALGEEEIDEAAAQAAIERAEEELKNIDHSENLEDLAHLQAVIAQNLAKIKLKRKRRH
ncbi:F0F1 ATP synthase subunit epsilon [Rubritalea tangerina]|uniref:ATP synthase epsilon chain n=1 Tax=Rubritalea tangerina TaxID=430798 RepID=A0ABW4ZAW8_9BACT